MFQKEIKELFNFSSLKIVVHSSKRIYPHCLCDYQHVNFQVIKGGVQYCRKNAADFATDFIMLCNHFLSFKMFITERRVLD